MAFGKGKVKKINKRTSIVDSDDTSISDSEVEINTDAISEVQADATSEEHIIARAIGEQSHPVIVSYFVEVKEEQTGILTLRVSNTRPPTQLKNQGRHVSAYGLMIEAVLARVSNKTPQEGLESLKKLLKEYISNKGALDGYEAQVNMVIELHQDEISTRESRIRIEQALRASKRFFSKNEVKDTITNLSDEEENTKKTKAYYNADRKKVLALEEDDIKRIRTALKRDGELQPYKEIINLAISYAIKLLNKMDEIAFTGKNTHAEDSEGSDISGALQDLRNVEPLLEDEEYTKKKAKEIGESIAFLFDYPAAEKQSKDKAVREEAGDLCIQVIRRHIKFIYDAFPNIRPAFESEDELEKLISPLFEKVRGELGWEQFIYSKDSFETNNKLFKRVTARLKIEDGKYLLDESRKFNAKSPNYQNQVKLHNESQVFYKQSIESNISRKSDKRNTF